MKPIQDILFFLVVFAVIVPTLLANIGEFDEHWQERMTWANKKAMDNFHPDPMEVVSHLNFHVRKATDNKNSTRRQLQRYMGPCMATNPIDQCWRCDRQWARNRQKMAKCALGFGRNTTGGLGGPIYVVTDPSDDEMINLKPGTLRHAVTRDGPLWIIFARNMLISLKEELLVSCDKTIDGRGASVHIQNGGQITLQGVHNVIISNLHIYRNKPLPGGMIRDSENHFGFRTRSDGDGISLFTASNVWIDHCSMSDCSDGIIDAIQGSTAITVSNCHFTKHNEVMLFGGSGSFTSDSRMQITVAFNHFGSQLVQRMPRVRFGFAHVVNNDYSFWQMYAIGGSSQPTILSQGNRFIAPFNPYAREVAKRDFVGEDIWKHWDWRSEYDLKLNGATFTESGKPFHKKGRKMIKPRPGRFASLLTRFSGALNCKKRKPC